MCCVCADEAHVFFWEVCFFSHVCKNKEELFRVEVGESFHCDFDAAALTFCHTRREMLQRVADRCGVAAGTGDSRLDVDSKG